MKKIINLGLSKLLFVLLLVSVLFSCVNNSDKKELIFLITLDTTRADSINYEINNKETPNLAYLASNGINYENAFSLIPITLPSHYSMFYSMSPWMVKVYNNGDKPNLTYPNLTEILRKNGFYTGAAISLGVLKSDFGLNRGFNKYFEDFPPGVWYKTAEDVNKDAFKLIENVKRKKAFYWVHYSDPHEPYYHPKYKGESKIFLNGNKIYSMESTHSTFIELEIELKPGVNYLQFNTKIPEAFTEYQKKYIRGFTLRDFKVTQMSKSTDMKLDFQGGWKWRRVKDKINYHSFRRKSKIVFTNKSNKPQKIKANFIYSMKLDNKILKKMYLEEVSYMDEKIGDLISFLKKRDLFKDSTFIIMGDHGEGFEEYRGHVGHIHYLNKVYLNVPLIISGKGINNSKIDKKLVSSLDIAPTILDIVNIKKPKYMIGSSLLKDKKNNKLFLETYRPQAYYNSFSIIEYPYQLIYFPEKTTSDKYEFINLQSDRYGVKNIINKDKALKNRMIQKVRKMAKFCLKNKKKTNKRSKKDEEILKSLGYI